MKYSPTRKLLSAIACAGLLGTGTLAINAAEDAAEYKLDWSDLKGVEKAPEWFKDAKFGIYFHWGVYSVPAFGSEWYPRWMHFEGTKEYKHHLEKYGHPSEFGYHDFVPMFKAEHFDPEAWADLFKKAGARFAGPVAEHHDGFAMWDSDVTPWNVVDKGPKRDITGELAKTIRARGMKFITTFHHARNNLRRCDPENYKYEYPHKRYFNNSHYPWVEGMPPTSDDPELRLLYGNIYEKEWLQDVWYAKLKEVIDKYSPDIIWFDSWLDRIPEIYRREFLRYYYNEAKKKHQEVVVTFKQHDLPSDLAVFNIEKGGMTEIAEDVWQCDDTISMGSWCYTEDLEIKPVAMVVHSLIDIVSKNGVLLLNISPRADGTIPQNQQDVLLRMGEWLAVNGEAIYATRPWLTHGEGPTGWKKNVHGGMATTNIYTVKDKRYTRSKDGRYVYAFVLGTPNADEAIDFEAFAKDAVGGKVKITDVELIGSREKVKWTRDERGLHITPSRSYASDIAIVYRLKVAR